MPINRIAVPHFLIMSSISRYRLCSWLSDLSPDLAGTILLLRRCTPSATDTHKLFQLTEIIFKTCLYNFAVRFWQKYTGIKSFAMIREKITLRSRHRPKMGRLRVSHILWCNQTTQWCCIDLHRVKSKVMHPTYVTLTPRLRPDYFQVSTQITLLHLPAFNLLITLKLLSHNSWPAGRNA